MNAPLHNVVEPYQTHRPKPDPLAVRRAFAALIDALGVTDAVDAQTPERAARLWLEHLTVGQGACLTAALGTPLPSEQSAPIVIDAIGFHLVCPHHLTVAAGTASIAYLPAGHIVGFGRLSRLVELGTARLALQEDAASAIAEALMHTLVARAVAVRLRAEHLCHTVLYPRSHGAVATTWGLLGEASACAELQTLLHR